MIEMNTLLTKEWISFFLSQNEISFFNFHLLITNPMMKRDAWCFVCLLFHFLISQVSKQVWISIFNLFGNCSSKWYCLLTIDIHDGNDIFLILFMDSIMILQELIYFIGFSSFMDMNYVDVTSLCSLVAYLLERAKRFLWFLWFLEFLYSFDLAGFFNLCFVEMEPCILIF